ncbi:hypothetical protein [Aureispira sp. CCB-E]|uniref:hypothetical protein n=1 Tax=Aureispira sp. CCB-E TaxID=3051121 RepID=UPI0028693517|nr:hypothetical protein [Aureispira sp. CCB-E]WMX13148.1 hypothetical protein QP953_20100 [Aureispira sp. CCB-E]
MIASRKEILKLNPTFSTFIIQLQNSTYNPELSHQYKEGEEILFENDKIEKLTKEAAQRLNQEAIDEFIKKKDYFPFEKETKLNFCGRALFKSTKTDTIVYLNDIADILNIIRQSLNESSILILGLIKNSWFQENDYAPISRAMNYLEEKINKNFDGGFILKENEILKFIPHLFWLIRCNASLPETYMTFPKSKTIFYICKYGIIHFEFYDEAEKKQILEILEKKHFEKVNSCNDPIEFDSFEGRRINLK